MVEPIRFLLNEEEVTVHEPPGLLVLDFLRRRRRLVGTKEGCKEGDCGACAVLVGDLRAGKVEYRPITSCLMPVGELQGKHLVTIEGINLPSLTPVQQAIVDEGATQCGFCTPGIVVSLTGFLMQDDLAIDDEGIQYALSGHLCRCTGYRSLRAGCRHLSQAMGGRTGVDRMLERGFLPAYFRDAARRLEAIQPPPRRNGNGDGVFIAGGTDLYVQIGEELPETALNVLNLYPEMRGIERENGSLRVGALTTFEEFAAHESIRSLIPGIQDYMFLIASWQIRNRATLGGNIVNASPIGDMTILLLAMRSQLVLQEGSRRREVAMTDFYQGYKEIDRSPGEILTQIRVPCGGESTRVHFEKVSKRKCLDIASVNSAICLSCREGIIEEAGLAVGGVAPVPLFLKRTSAFLKGRRVEAGTVREAWEMARHEISPIDDVRGSADYKRLLARQLLIGHFTSLFPEKMRVRDFYE